MKRLVFILFSALLLVSGNGSALNSVMGASTENAQAVAQDDQGPHKNEVATIRGTMNSLLKVNENTHPVFHHVQHNKRVQHNSTSWNSLFVQNSYYDFYSLRRINSLHFSPFYIAYHRLTV